MLQNSYKLLHEEVFFQLKELIENNRLPHALLFTGPSGIGKKTTAICLAQLLLKDNFNAELHEFFPETSIGTYSIDQIRKLQQICSIKPYNGKARVIVLDQADRLTLQASNAFLKLLEEPPEGNYFILISAQGYKLLPTLLSRLSKFLFKKPQEALFEALLKEQKLDLGHFQFLAQGSLGQAHLVSKYKTYLEQLAALLPYSYRSEWAYYRRVFEAFDDDEAFSMLEFIPLFEDLMLDFYAYTSNFQVFKYLWSHLKKPNELSYMSLKKALGQLTLSSQAHLKASSCFDHFFLSL